MSCTVDTDSIDLEIVGGALQADLIVDPAAAKSPNELVVGAAGAYVASDGWVALPAALAFSSSDGHTYVATTSADLTGFISPGARVRLVQSSTTLYFIVTAVSNGAITLYGGTDYTLANSPITVPYFSNVKAPFGFPLNPAKWTEELRDTSDRLQGAPSSGTWYNPGSLSLAVPIGAWRLQMQVAVASAAGGGGAVGQPQVTLSTANNSESDPDLTAVGSGNTNVNGFTHAVREKFLQLAVKTSYFLNIRVTTASTGNLGYVGTMAPTLVRAICAYL